MEKLKEIKDPINEPFIVRAKTIHPYDGAFDVRIAVQEDGDIYLGLENESLEIGDARNTIYTVLEPKQAYVLYKLLGYLVADEIEKANKDAEFWKDWDPNVRFTPETAAEYIKNKKD